MHSRVVILDHEVVRKPNYLSCGVNCSLIVSVADFLGHPWYNIRTALFREAPEFGTFLLFHQ